MNRYLVVSTQGLEIEDRMIIARRLPEHYYNSYNLGLYRLYQIEDHKILQYSVISGEGLFREMKTEQL